MAGIIANSASVTMLAGDTAADKAIGGFVVGERVTLAITPSGAALSWGMAAPSGSTVRAIYDDPASATPTFVPDVPGFYVLSVVVDSTTTYVLRASVASIAMGTFTEAIRFGPVGRTAVPAPPLGAAIFYDSTTGLSAKLPDDVCTPIAVGVAGAALTDADQTLQIGEGVHRVQQTALTANRQKTLGTTGAAAGHVLELHRTDGATFTLAVINGGPGAGTLLTYPSGERHSAVFRFDGTNWALWERRKMS